MLSPDDKHLCLEQTKNAYQALQLFLEIQNDNESDKKFNQTAFSIIEHMISDLASKWGIPSTVYDAHMARIDENKNRNKRIQELEENIAKTSDYTTFKENMKTISTRINQVWNAKGFGNYDQMSIGEYESVTVTLRLTPAREPWNIDIKVKGSEDNIPKEISDAFEAHKFELYNQEEEYVYLYDCDSNRYKIEHLVRTIYPGCGIIGWKSRNSRDIFLIDGVEIKLTDLSYFKEETINE